MKTTITRRYVARPGAPLSDKEAARIGKSLDRLARKHGGVTPALVVTTARSKASPLHSFFEWDDGKAAEEYRLVQARRLIGVVQVVIEGSGEPITVRAFPTIVEEDGGDRTYRPLADIMSNAEWRAQHVAAAKAELDSVKRRFGHLTELNDVWDAIGASLVEEEAA